MLNQNMHYASIDRKIVNIVSWVMGLSVINYYVTSKLLFYQMAIYCISDIAVNIINVENDNELKELFIN